MTRTGDREISVVSGRLPDNTGELACMLKGIKTAHVLCVCLISVEYVDKQRTFQTGYALHIFKNETSHFR